MSFIPLFIMIALILGVGYFITTSSTSFHAFYKINLWATLITLALYLTILGGLIAQFFLGILQLIFAIGLFPKWDTFSLKIKQQLTIYWGIVILYGVTFTLTIIYDLLSKWHNIQEIILVIGIGIIPMSIAGYFTYICYQLKNIPHPHTMTHLDE